ncbi:hypothetical protein ACN42_g2318 [Penicillium freii]|uniref:Uncharacterized protein n=1 Tax=Penicillium freii TaxID=48697 RepID=A0A101MQB4_PENFR|nr:hypothetical protein ACN42_g2318 [Penicillium freii]
MWPSFLASSLRLLPGGWGGAVFQLHINKAVALWLPQLITTISKFYIGTKNMNSRFDLIKETHNETRLNQE